MDGEKFFQLEGRLMSRDRSNILHPVRAAKLLYWDARDNRDAKPLELTVDDGGEFTVAVGLPWSKEMACRDGVVVETQYVGEEHFVIRAPGCSELKLTVDPKWSPHDIELKCSAIHNTG